VNRSSRIPFVIATLLASAMIGHPMHAHAQQNAAKPKKAKASGDIAVYKPTPLFMSATPLEVTLTYDVGKVRRDRTGTTPSHPASLAFTDSAGKRVEIPLQVRTRGIWRKKNCENPPLRLDLAKGKVKQTVFAGQNHLKLAITCRNNDQYEQFTLLEANLYRVYQVLTPASHRIRLARVTVVDSASAKQVLTRWGFFIEPEAELAARLGGVPQDIPGGTSNDLESANAAVMGLFQYMIGNTDWSVSGLHNIELVAHATGLISIAYDFDWTGAVNPPYAFPDAKLPIRRVTDHLYRGPCVPPDYYPPAFELFNKRREAITALYSDSIGALIEPKRAKETLDFFNDFFKTVAHPRDAKSAIYAICGF
jgi:hypothetical protein